MGDFYSMLLPFRCFVSTGEIDMTVVAVRGIVKSIDIVFLESFANGELDLLIRVDGRI
jgi:hypothetical protein